LAPVVLAVPRVRLRVSRRGVETLSTISSRARSGIGAAELDLAQGDVSRQGLS